MQQELKPLTVYRASAGSGKTFTLAVEFIRLLVINPEDYRHILAVTFTNKATEEMKQRILSQLYGLSRDVTLEESLVYLDKIKERTGLDEHQIKKNAALALHYLLNDYSSFHIETIDSFFQRVLRNMARELELTPNLRLELNDKEVEGMAIDHLIESLRSDHALFQSIMGFVYHKVSDNKSWNVISVLKEFGLEMFSDIYKDFGKEFALRAIGKNSSEIDEQEKERRWNDYFNRVESSLSAWREKASNKVREIGKGYFKLLSDHQLSPTDIKGNMSRGINLYFNKLQNGNYTENCLVKDIDEYMSNAELWTKKGKKKDLVLSVVGDVLIDYLKDAEHQRKLAYRQALSVDYTLKYLYQLKFLSYVEREVRRLNAGANRFLLSDTQHLLRSFIDKTDAPFIYEKIGGQLKHIMIDEFQDTSIIQWQNFKVLIDDCMSRHDEHHPSQCLIVGDVKQSIYRWRSGDWRLLNAIDDQFTHSEQMIRHEPLKTNHRSCERIVLFNNAFFAQAIQTTQKQLKEKIGTTSPQLALAYHDVEQEVFQKDRLIGRGYVRISMCSESPEVIMNEVGQQVKRLLDVGNCPSDIAILVRKNKEIPVVAEWFMTHQPDVRIISDLAFRLDSSVAVNAIIAALRYLNDSRDVLSLSVLINIWNQTINSRPSTATELYCGDAPSLPKPLMKALEQLRYMPVIQVAESLCGLFKLSSIEGEASYLSTFFDMVTQYQRDNTSDISSLLDYWDNYLHKKCIHCEEANGVRLTTIHKSKGLEFKHVIIPFCDWSIEMQQDTFWCTPNEPPYNQLPIVIVDYTDKLLNTIYDKAYKEEYLQVIVDNMNLLYVAFTRAEESLFVFGRMKETPESKDGQAKDTKKKAERRSDLIVDVMAEVAKVLGATVTCKRNLEEGKESLLFEYGQLEDAKSTPALTKTTDNVFLQKETQIPISFSTETARASFVQSNASIRYVENDEESEGRHGQYILRGNVIHSIMSKIHTMDDLGSALRELEQDGILYTEDISREDIIGLIHRNLQLPDVRDWFSGRWDVYSECTILEESDGIVHQRRPDRVMTNGTETIVVDYKSGYEQESTRERYHLQVSSYVRLLTEMGFPHVKGYLWYLGEQKITPVIESRL